jgi:hypothetical protein
MDMPIKALPRRAQLRAGAYSCASCGRPLPKRPDHQPRFCGACRKSAFRARPSAARYDGQGPARNDVIRAELIGSDTAIALGHAVKAYAPVLELCRELVAAGQDPTTRLEAYRGPILLSL